MLSFMEPPAYIKEKMGEVAGCCELVGDLAWNWSEDEDGEHRVHVYPAYSLINNGLGYPDDIRWDIGALMNIFDEVKDIQWHPEGGQEAALHIEAWDGFSIWITIHEKPDPTT